MNPKVEQIEVLTGKIAELQAEIRLLEKSDHPDSNPSVSVVNDLSIIDNLNDFVVKTDQNGCFLFVNRAYCAIFGKKPDELIGKNFMPLVHPDDQAATAAAMASLNNPPYHCMISQRAMTAKGWRYIEWNDKAIRNHKGEVIEVIGVGRDITQQVLSEDELKESKERLKFAFDHSDNSMFDVDLISGITTFSSCFLNSLGLSLVQDEKISSIEINRKVLSFIHPDDTPSIKEWVRTVLLSSNKTDEFEYRIRYVDRGYVWVKSKLHYIKKDSEGNLVRLVGLQYEIDKQKREEIIREKFQKLIKQDLFLQNMETVVVNIEKLLSDFFEGYSVVVALFQEVTGKLIYTSKNKDFLNIEQLIKDIAKKSKLVYFFHGKEYEKKYIFKQSQSLESTPGFIGVIPHLQGDRLLGFLGFYKREKYSKKHQIEISGFANYTDQIWLHIEIMLAEKFLLDSQQQSMQAERLKATFMANISHELRTPLNAIIGFSSLIARRKLSESDQKQYTEIIASSGKSLLNLVNDIIDISKIEAGEVTINISTCILNNFLDQIYASFLKKTIPPGLTLVLEKGIENKFFSLNTDVLRLKQVYTNLIENAIKFTPSGEVVFGYRMVDEGIEFFVRDTGIGISWQNINRVFDPFFQVEADTTRRYGGSGLGLTICKNIVEIMGGEIRIYSKEGEGSEVVFTIDPNSTMDIKMPSIPSDKNRKFPDLSTKTILVVDENNEGFLLIKEILKPSGASVIWSKNGLLAVNLCVNKVIDLVITDISLPVMNGYDLLVQLRAIKKNIPVIIQTSFVQPADKERCIRLGCSAYLTKPFDADEFVNEVFKALKIENAFF